MTPPPIVLLTDFGTVDPFVGIMKCVIAARCPATNVIDLTHDVRPQSVVEGAFWLDRSEPWLPPRSVCVAVVDPGVGSDRRSLVVESGGRSFVGPDNGLLTPLAERAGARAFVVEVDRLGLELASATFHGRDLYAPLGAELAAGRVAASAVGPAAHALAPSPLATARSEGATLVGEIVVVDRFGNLISNVDGDAARAVGASSVVIAGRRVALQRTYSDVAAGDLVALTSSFGTIEVARREGSAASALDVAHGEPLRVEVA
jgi:S-adenosylmethionine hydrolase